MVTSKTNFDNKIEIGDAPFRVYTVSAPLDITLGVANHKSLILESTLENGEKKRIYVDGLAINHKNGNKLPFFGSPLDKLVVHIQPDIPLWNDKNHQSSLLFETNSKEEMMKVVNQVYSKADLINSQQLSYDPLGKNSNTVFADLVNTISSVVPIKQEDYDKAINLGAINPGSDKQLVTDDKDSLLIKAYRAVAQPVSYVWDMVTGAFTSVVAWAGDTFFPNSNDEKVAQNNQTTETPNNLQPVNNPTTQAYKAGQPLYGYIPPETPYVKKDGVLQTQNIG
jgi:hypothetical protein